MARDFGPNGHDPRSFEEWLASMPIEVRESIKRAVKEEAGEIWISRGGGISSPEQRTQDIQEAQRALFDRFAPKDRYSEPILTEKP